MSIKIMDNYLKKDVYLNVKSTFESGTFPWFMTEKVGPGNNIKDLKNKYNFQFTHVFFWRSYYQFWLF